MISALRRKTAQVARDPILRRWLVARALGKEKGPARFIAGEPPYLSGHRQRVKSVPIRTEHLADLDAPLPQTPLELPVLGKTARVVPGAETELFERVYSDTETLLAIHRFAWLPLLGQDADLSWVSALWAAWIARFATPDNSWAWHPYTAAERAINILDYAERTGLPGPREETLATLADHGEAIAGRLEYYGDHYTSNHLSNNGRGLYFIGLGLGIDEYTEHGSRILLAEAGRIFGRSGILREGSTHYHLLLTRNYASVWLSARAHGRPEADTFREVTRRALDALPHLALPGGFPLIGDISPDCPPWFLAGLLPNGDLGTGWCGLLDSEARHALAELKAESRPVSPDLVAADGWIRFDHAPWAALWFIAPDGWSPMPGHGHQDLGSFEVHHHGVPLFRDPGRGSYAPGNESTVYVSALSHNSLIVDGYDPYPPNRPYYSNEFRHEVGGAPPRVTRTREGIALNHDGFARLKGVGSVTRTWRFGPTSMEVRDRIEGNSRHRVTRRLHTTHAVERESDGVRIDSGTHSFRLKVDGEITLFPGTCWSAYGEGGPATAIDISIETELPAEMTISVEVT